MKARIVEYFRTNKWWILIFLLLVVADGVLTILLLTNQYGIEANPFVPAQGISIDWTFHMFRIDVVLLLIPLIAMTPWLFTRNWLLQSFIIAYAWTILNNAIMLASKGAVAISVYNFMPNLYLVGFLLQFLVGVLILWAARRLFIKGFDFKI